MYRGSPADLGGFAMLGAARGRFPSAVRHDVSPVSLERRNGARCTERRNLRSWRQSRPRKAPIFGEDVGSRAKPQESSRPHPFCAGRSCFSIRAEWARRKTRIRASILRTNRENQISLCCLCCLSSLFRRNWDMIGLPSTTLLSFPTPSECARNARWNSSRRSSPAPQLSSSLRPGPDRSRICRSPERNRRQACSRFRNRSGPGGAGPLPRLPLRRTRLHSRRTPRTADRA